MTRLETALENVLKDVNALPYEKTELHLALNRCLAADVKCDTDLPSFAKSAMDGFAIRLVDIEEDLEVMEFIPAGHAPQKSIGEKQCSRIMTGAMVPNGADTVIMIEHTKTLENGKIRFIKESTKNNILAQGEDKKIGDIALRKGSILKPAHVGILASVGCVNPLVHQVPQVGILATGSELVHPSQTIQAPQIRNSNSFQIQALCTKLGAGTTNLGVVIDDPDAILEKIKSLLTKHQIIVFTGGASFGDHDFSEKVLKELGAEIILQKLAIQPGKPMLFAKLGDKFIFGLSGNPVSSSVQFELLVKPLIQQLMGKKDENKIYQIPLAESMERKKSERDLFFPIQLNKTMQALPLEYHGSAHLNAFENAEAIACFPIGKNRLEKGDLVDVRFL